MVYLPIFSLLFNNFKESCRLISMYSYFTFYSFYVYQFIKKPKIITEELVPKHKEAHNIIVQKEAQPNIPIHKNPILVNPTNISPLSKP